MPSPRAAALAAPLLVLLACADFDPIERELNADTQALTWEELSTQYPHVKVYGPGEEDQLWPEVLVSGPDPTGKAKDLQPARIVTATELHKTIILKALASAAPITVATLERVAMISWPKESSDHASKGASTMARDVVINADIFKASQVNAEPVGIQSTVHEMAHTFVHLLYWATELPAKRADATDQAYFDTYSPELRELASKLIDQHRLQRGLLLIWEELHDSGISLGFTQPYLSQSTLPWDDEKVPAPTLTNKEALNHGFASSRASVSASEDLAEYVATVQAPTSAKRGVCPLFADKSRLTPELAIPYIKLSFLRDLGLITEARFRGCVQGTIPTFEPSGIHFETGRAFTSNLQAGFAESGGTPFFRVLASAPGPDRLMIDLRLPNKDTSPLGLYRTETVPFIRPAGFHQTAIYRHTVSPPDSESSTGAEGGAYVLVTEFSLLNLRGVILGLVFDRAIGLDTESMPFDTFSLP